MKKLAAVAFLLSGVVAATAGYHYSANVVVSTASRYAQGYLGTARNSADSMQYLACSKVGNIGYRYGTCAARDAAGVSVSCYTSDTGLLDAISSLKADDFLFFSWDTGGNCTAVQTSTASYTEPKQ